MSEHRNFPTAGLHLLARDPIVRWGCSYSEIIGSVTKGAMFSLVPVFLILVGLPLSGMFKFGLSFIMFFVVTLGTARYLCHKISKSRSDKPLFYDKHTKDSKTGAFAKANTNYQRERNLK